MHAPSRFLRPAALLAAGLFAGLGLAHASQLGRSMAEADAALNANYQRALATLPDARVRSLLRRSQRAWAEHRDAEVGLHAALYRASKGGLHTNLVLTEARAAHLDSIAKRTSAYGYGEGPE